MCKQSLTMFLFKMQLLTLCHHLPVHQFAFLWTNNKFKKFFKTVCEIFKSFLLFDVAAKVPVLDAIKVGGAIIVVLAVVLEVLLQMYSIRVTLPPLIIRRILIKRVGLFKYV